MQKIAAIVLAAGEGTRMKSTTRNKVVMEIGGKPLIAHTYELLKKLPITPIVVVVGFAKESVEQILGDNVLYALQEKRLGTAHAAQTGLAKLPDDISHVLIVQGDDSAFYKVKTLEDLIEKHITSQAVMTFLTIAVANPFGLGRIVRDETGAVIKIVEEKDATAKQRLIKEINPACYICRVDFLKKYLPKVEKSPVTGEYYLVSLIELAVQYKENIQTLSAGNIPWRGVNTQNELLEAEMLLKQEN